MRDHKGQTEGEWFNWAVKQMAYAPPEQLRETGEGSLQGKLALIYSRTFGYKPPEQVREMLANIAEAVISGHK